MKNDAEIMQGISNAFGLERAELRTYLSTAPYRYKVFRILKRNDKGTRVIAQPSRGLKTIQRFVLENFCEPHLPVHDCATAYQRGSSIKANALAHSNSKYLLKMDFKNFFPSLTDADLTMHTDKYLKEKSDETDFVFSNLFFRKEKASKKYFMSIGAPSSPFISNTLLYDFDCIISDIAAVHSVVYTRYADDMTFSSNTKDLLFSYPDIIIKALDGLQYPKIKLNNEKTVFSSKKRNRHVTGIVLTNDNTISIGRAKKRVIKSLCFRYLNGELNFRDIQRLSGFLSYIQDVEPTFIDSLKSKYGDMLIESIRRDAGPDT